jgi:hypothetical protein
MTLQGLLKLTFGDANLVRVMYHKGDPPRPVFALLLNNVAVSVLGIKVPPNVVSDLILFSDPENAAHSNLAGCLAVRKA